MRALRLLSSYMVSPCPSLGLQPQAAPVSRVISVILKARMRPYYYYLRLLMRRTRLLTATICHESGTDISFLKKDSLILNHITHRLFFFKSQSTSLFLFHCCSGIVAQEVPFMVHRHWHLLTRKSIAGLQWFWTVWWITIKQFWSSSDFPFSTIINDNMIS